MNKGSEIHIFWGAPSGPLKMMVSQEPTSLISTTDPWKKVQLLYNQHSLHLKDEKCKNKNVEDYQILEAAAPPDLLNGHFLGSSLSRSVSVKDDCIFCISETQTQKFQKSYPLGMSDITKSDVQIRECKGRVQHLTGEEECQKLFSENKKITVEQHKQQSHMCSQNVQKHLFQLDHECAAAWDLVCNTEQINTGPGAIGMRCMPTEHHGTQNRGLEKSSLATRGKPRAAGAVGKVLDLTTSTETEFLSVMTSSQFAFLAQRTNEGESSINKRTVNTEVEAEASPGEIKITEDNLIQPDDDFVERYERRQSQAYSLELFSPAFPETKSSHIHIKSGKGLKENVGSQELFGFDDKLPSNEVCIEPCRSGILCSQVNASHKSPTKQNGTSEGKSGRLRVRHVSKKTKLVSNAGGPTTAKDQRSVSEFKGIKETTLIRNCDSKSQKYNCLVLVLSPCHVKEISIKSGPNSGSKVPLAAVEVTDQSAAKRRVFLWRMAAFWAVTVFLGDVVLLTDVTVCEDHWVGETVLQSTFTTQLLNLGSYSSVQPEEYSSIVSDVVLQDLLAYVSSKHSYLRDLRPRPPQEVSNVEFVALEQLQPGLLVHALLRVVDVTVLTEAVYSYRGQKQRKVLLTVEQVQGQHYVLVLWGRGATWYPQLQRKKGVILVKAQILELVFHAATAQKIVINAHSSLKSIFSSLPNITYTGCAKCGLELETDENKIYKQCFSCLPCTTKKIYYRPALMTIADGLYKVCVHVGSKLMEKILLNISPDWLSRVIAPPSEVTYGLVAADMLHSLLAACGAPCVLKVQSLFVLEENSYPLQQDLSLLDFSPAWGACS
ncbi:shieldin complex subunit 2 isoform X2 [Pipistrellus kuhlii]|uniref:shieldin complex subunit 2 isoform X2 n=1 Tax=Pipistrellus kuhlii TaxID=59472 RepID=UPI00174EE8F0|nr:shieldin complex subunit 2 isoform X2 [Pipistrellus kuhlii]